MPVENGNKVKIDYEGKLEDGTVFDASAKHGAPLEFEVGSGRVIPGFDAAVLGMNVGEEKEVTIPPADAYGDYNAELSQQVPRDQLPQDQTPEVGMILMLHLQNGAQFPAKILEVTDEHVKIDMNHPLAGKTLIFKIKLVEVK